MKSEVLSVDEVTLLHKRDGVVSIVSLLPEWNVIQLDQVTFEKLLEKGRALLIDEDYFDPQLPLDLRMCDED